MSDLIKSILLLFSLVSSEVYAQNLQINSTSPKGMGELSFPLPTIRMLCGIIQPALLACEDRDRGANFIFSFPNVQASWNQNVNYNIAG